MPYIQSKNHVLNASNQESIFLDDLAREVNKRYHPAKINIASEELVDFYYGNEEFYIDKIKKFLQRFPSSMHPDYYKSLEANLGEPLTKFLSIDINGNYTLLNTHNSLFNILFTYYFIDVPAFKQLAEKYLKDMSIFTPIKKVIKDDKILSLIYPLGYEKVTLYDFLNQYSFRWNYDSLLSIPGIGKARLENIKKALKDFGYPLIVGNMHNFHKTFNNLRIFNKILLSTTEDLKEVGLSNYDLELLQGTKYIDNLKTVKSGVQSTALIDSMAKEVAENTAKREPTIEKNAEPTNDKTSYKDKALNIISKMPIKTINTMINENFKRNLKLLLELGKDEPKLLLDYAECIPFKKYKNVDSINEVLNIISIQPKLIRKLEKRMIVILMTSQPLPMHNIIYSDKLTKAESVSLNAYVNKIVAERLSTKKETIKNR